MGATFVSSRAVARIVGAAALCGANAEELRREIGVSVAELSDIDGRVAPEVYLAALRAARAHVPGPALAFQAAAIRATSYNLLRFLCGSSATLGDALVRAARYLRSETDMTSWVIRDEGDLVALRIHRHVEVAAAEGQLADELVLAEIVTLARDFTARDVSPAQVRFAFPSPLDPQLHRSFFRAPVDFDAPVTELRWSREVLASPLVGADEVAVQFFEHEMQRALERDSTGHLVGRVRRELAGSVKAGPPRIDEVARALGMSGRTLRRRLLDEGASFRQLHDQARFAYAEHCMARGDVTLGAIAIALGFSEPSAFHRAFRRWSGTTPVAYARARRAEV